MFILLCVTKPRPDSRIFISNYLFTSNPFVCNSSYLGTIAEIITSVTIACLKSVIKEKKIIKLVKSACNVMQSKIYCLFYLNILKAVIHKCQQSVTTYYILFYSLYALSSIGYDTGHTLTTESFTCKYYLKCFIPCINIIIIIKNK